MLSRGVVEKHVTQPYASQLHWPLVDTLQLLTLFILQLFLFVSDEVLFLEPLKMELPILGYFTPICVDLLI